MRSLSTQHSLFAPLPAPAMPMVWHALHQWRPGHHWRGLSIDSNFEQALAAQEHVWHQLSQALKDKKPGPAWKLTDETADLAVALPEIEDGSLAARLSDDGRSLKLMGTACTCTDRTLAEVALPFGPTSANDVEVEQHADGTVVVRAWRKKKPPLDIKIVKASPAPEPVAQEPVDSSSQKKEELEELTRKFSIAVNSVAKQAAVVEKMQAANDSSDEPGDEKPQGDADESEKDSDKPADDAVEDEVPTAEEERDSKVALPAVEKM